MKLLAQQMATLTDNQSTILRSIRQKIDETLQTPETRLLGILVLMGPWLVRFDICTIRKADVYRIKGNNQILVVVDFLKCLDYAGLLADSPGKGLVGDGVTQAHAFFIDIRQMIFVEGRWVISFESDITVKFPSLSC